MLIYVMMALTGSVLCVDRWLQRTRTSACVRLASAQVKHFTGNRNREGGSRRSIDIGGEVGLGLGCMNTDECMNI